MKAANLFPHAFFLCLLFHADFVSHARAGGGEFISGSRAGIGIVTTVVGLVDHHRISLGTFHRQMRYPLRGVGARNAPKRCRDIAAVYVIHPCSRLGFRDAVDGIVSFADSVFAVDTVAVFPDCKDAQAVNAFDLNK